MVGYTRSVPLRYLYSQQKLTAIKNFGTLPFAIENA
jgi:hypothetical protein